MTLRRAVAVLLAVLAATFAPMSEVGAHDPPEGHTNHPNCEGACAEDLARAEEATWIYQNVAFALADGFVPVTPCEKGQGIHFVNVDRLRDSVIDAAFPEILLYVPDTEAGLRLVGVEYGPVDTAAVDRHPKLFGRHFDGPMPPHNALQRGEHYDLHVWLWSEQHPEGLFAQQNSTVSCP